MKRNRRPFSSSSFRKENEQFLSNNVENDEIHQYDTETDNTTSRLDSTTDYSSTWLTIGVREASTSGSNSPKSLSNQIDINFEDCTIDELSYRFRETSDNLKKYITPRILDEMRDLQCRLEKMVGALNENSILSDVTEEDVTGVDVTGEDVTEEDVTSDIESFSSATTSDIGHRTDVEGIEEFFNVEPVLENVLDDTSELKLSARSSASDGENTDKMLAQLTIEMEEMDPIYCEMPNETKERFSSLKAKLHTVSALWDAFKSILTPIISVKLVDRQSENEQENPVYKDMNDNHEMEKNILEDLDFDENEPNMVSEDFDSSDDEPLSFRTAMESLSASSSKSDLCSTKDQPKASDQENPEVPAFSGCACMKEFYNKIMEQVFINRNDKRNV